MIASHNSWSYLPPLKWYHWPIAWIAKCQSKTIVDQLASNVELFDLRLREVEGTWYVSHGIVLYKKFSDIHLGLMFLNQHKCKLRIVCEYNSKPENSNIIMHEFLMICAKIYKQYPDIEIVEIRYKWLWNQPFKTSTVPITEKHASVCGKGLTKIWPWLWSKLHNQKIDTTNDIVMIDFI